MKVKFNGTRGSTPVAGKNKLKYGGNTTSIEIKSDCLPKGNHLIVDAGSGIVPSCVEIMDLHGNDFFNGKIVINLLLTHLHHDHTQGLFLAPMTFIKAVRMNLIGPKEHGIGPREMIQTMMKPPFFPVHSKTILSHFACNGLEHPNSQVIIFHPVGGMKLLAVEQFENMENDGGHVPVGRSSKYPTNECLVIKMHKSNHPENTISFRFEERTTGKVFVFLTDHENQCAIPTDLRRHISNADLLVLDAQYSQEKYDNLTAGYGHGTGPYCAKIALECGTKKLGLTHHDPFSSDDQVNAILQEAQTRLTELKQSKKGYPLTEKNIFACADYQEVIV